MVLRAAEPRPPGRFNSLLLTRPFDGETARKPPSDADLSDREGMGLYALLRTVVDHFQGSVYLRCGRYFVDIASSYGATSPDRGVRYRCRVTEFPDKPFPFLGNLLTVNLPLLTAADAEA